MILIYQDREPRRMSAVAEGDALWLDAAELYQATGWGLRAEGACRGDVCVPLACGSDGTRVDLAALARALGQPIVRDDAHGVWSVGRTAGARRTSAQSLEAPDFALPDLDGRVHRLRDWCGRKIFLVSWASW